MTNREKLQCAYELAFHPPRLNRLWRQLQRGEIVDREQWGELLDTALRLQLALPEDGLASPRALQRLAGYQARSRAFGMVRFLKNLRQWLGRGRLAETEVPPHLVRDIVLPPLAR